MQLLTKKDIKKAVKRIVKGTPVIDMHTHLFAPELPGLLLRGIDEQLTYHYLLSEAFRCLSIPYEEYWALPHNEKADLIWKTLFCERTPVSEACVAVITTMQEMGFAPEKKSLSEARRYFAEKSEDEYIDDVFALANVKTVIMTNDPFDMAEREIWLNDSRLDARNGKQKMDKRFRAALRIDPLLLSWETAAGQLAEMGYNVLTQDTQQRFSETRRFLLDWMRRMDAEYMAVSLPDVPIEERSVIDITIRECVLPVCRELNRPFALMIGVRRQVNPHLELAGDAVGVADLKYLQTLLQQYPHNKFMATLLSRENQHELTVMARKFRNLLPFGCWWFMNNPSLITDLTRMRLEMLGTSFVMQHSDCRVLDQLISKWDLSRRLLAETLYERYESLLRQGWAVRDSEIERDVKALLGASYRDFLKAEF